MVRWHLPTPVAVPEALREFVGGHPLLAETLVRRGVLSAADAAVFLDPERGVPVDGLELPGMAAAVARIRQALDRGERICVWGDFDVDGQTATTVLVETLHTLAADVIHHIPVRASESHGVNLPMLQEVIERGTKLVLTCDTGITAHAAVEYARSRGVDFVVTDHHALGESLPDACAVVNPQLLPEGHPLHSLPGVGVAYKLAEVLLRDAEKEEAAAGLLDLAALGIVADLAMLQGETRRLLQRGLAVLRTTARTGLQMLYEQARLNKALLNEESIGFAIAPRLNALGRLGDANGVVDFLTTRDEIMAKNFAAQLEDLNNRRRHITDQIFAGAQAQLENDPQLGRHAALVLAGEGWEAGVIGIVAARLVEYYHKPALLIALDDAGQGRGSARSIEGVNITAAIARQAALLGGFGGHPMAAGFSISGKQIELFRLQVSEAVRDMLAGIEPEPALPVDGVLGLGEISIELAEELERLAPFGPGNPTLNLMVPSVRVASARTFGQDNAHRRIVLAGGSDERQEAIWWRSAEASLPDGEFDLACTLRVNDFQGERRVQLVWVDSRPASGVQAAAGARRGLTVIDLRTAEAPERTVQELLAQGDLAIWAEGGGRLPAGAVPRDRLQPAGRLAVWTAPPGSPELTAALQRVRPHSVYLFALLPAETRADAFLQRLGGLVKHAINAYGGRVPLEQLAGLTAQTAAAVRAGLEWLANLENGVTSRIDADGWVQIEGGGAGDAAAAARAAAIVEALMKESAAYRRYFQRADAERILIDP